MIKYECDMCGKCGPNEHDVLTVRLPIPDDGCPFGDNMHEFMLCKSCALNLSAFIQAQAQCMTQAMHRAASEDNGDEDDGTDFYVVDLGGGMIDATRSKIRGKGHRKLTRADIYRGRQEEALVEYSHAFMCCCWPDKGDTSRPSKEQWMSEVPYPFEVDKFLSDVLFRRNK